MLCIGTCLAAVSLASASAETFTQKKDGVTITCDSDTREVNITTDLEYDKGVEETVQELLHTRAMVFIATGEFANLTGKLINNNVRPEDDFYQTYDFFPTKVTFNNVVYELEKDVMKITSNAKDAQISNGCVGCFELTKKMCLVPSAGRIFILQERTNAARAPKKLIIEGDFQNLPQGFFYGVQNLETVDITKSNIKSFLACSFFLCEDLKEINVNPNCIQDFSLYNLNINATKQLHTVTDEKYRGCIVSHYAIIPGTINGNIQEVIQKQCDDFSKEAKARIDEKKGPKKEGEKDEDDLCGCCLVQ